MNVFQSLANTIQTLADKVEVTPDTTQAVFKVAEAMAAITTTTPTPQTLKSAEGVYLTNTNNPWYGTVCFACNYKGHRANKCPNLRPEHLEEALSKIDSNAFLNSHGKSKDGKKILERLWQVELYCALKEHLYEKANISLEVGRMYCDDGIIDLYIPKYGWGIELLIDGVGMKEHYNRFKEDGKYSLIPMKDYIILDIRQTVMAKKLYPKTWYVVPNNNFTILTILEKGLTFAEKSPEKQLQVPNLIAAQHFANAVLDHYGLHVSDITNALQKVVSTGDISELLGFYNRVMIKRDVGDDDLRNKLEEHHRDSFNYALLKNGLLQPNIEFESPITTGWIDLLIKTVTNRIIITEWKVLRINFIDIQPAILQPGMKKSVEFQKALTLSNISDITSVLQLRISSYDKFGRGGKTIREWILKQGPSDQLINYRASPEITELRKTYKAVAYLVVIVGSRKILLWQLSNNGKFLEEPLLSSW
ncbi:7341_t:CDS:2 [Entrophospora sp. SA101]|nr:7341_t:CDS:2 [Entrophospora sp. SA101]